MARQATSFAVYAALLLSASFACRQPRTVEPASADLVVLHAKVHTMDDRQPRATAFAVQGGRFVAVGDDAAMTAWRGPQTRVIDARGRTIIPGLNDSHLHVTR